MSDRPEPNERNTMSDEYTELERLAKAADMAASAGDWFAAEGTIDNFQLACSPEVILKLIQKARAQTQLVEAPVVAEWSDDGYCPVCGGREGYKHFKKCLLAAALVASGGDAMTLQKKFEKWFVLYGNSRMKPQQYSAYLAGSKEAREEAIRECADIVATSPSPFADNAIAILALLEKP